MQAQDDIRRLIAEMLARCYEVERGAPAPMTPLDLSLAIVDNEHVEREIASFTGCEREFFLDAYRRSGLYRPMILAQLQAAGLPEQLSWLPLVESGFKDRALSSRARARSLAVHRLDRVPLRSRRVRLGRRADGPGEVDRGGDRLPHRPARPVRRLADGARGLQLRRAAGAAPDQPPEGRATRPVLGPLRAPAAGDAALRAALPRHARHPRGPGALRLRAAGALRADRLRDGRVRVGATQLEPPRRARSRSTAARWQELNPELRRNATPAHAVRPPGAAGRRHDAGRERIEPRCPQYTAARASTTHRVGRGETLSTIAARYGTSVEAIMRVNRIRSANRIWPGQRLEVPVRGGARRRRPGAADRRDRSDLHRALGRHAVDHRAAPPHHRRAHQAAQRARPATRSPRARCSACAPRPHPRSRRRRELRRGRPRRRQWRTPGGASPSARRYQVRSGDTPSSIADAHKVKLGGPPQARQPEGPGAEREARISPGQWRSRTRLRE